MTHKLGVLAVVALVALAAASTGGARSAGKICPKFKQARITYESQTVGTGWTCGAAKSWIARLSLDRVPKNVTKNIPLTNGPRGYHCLATPLSRGGHATAGTCIKGTIAYPKSGFAWLPS
jgi:hypothetical protein